MSSRPPEIVREAAESVGGLTELARQLGVKANTFYQWREVPANRVLEIEKLTGVPRHDLRPDLYPREA